MTPSSAAATSDSACLRSAPIFLVGREIVARHPRHHGVVHQSPLADPVGLASCAQHFAARIEVERESRISEARLVVDAAPASGRRHEVAQQRRDALGIDRKFEARIEIAERRRHCRACSSSSRSGSTWITSLSTVAEAAMAAAMISPWTRSDCMRASIRPARHWLRIDDAGHQHRQRQRG